MDIGFGDPDDRYSWYESDYCDRYPIIY